MDGIAFPPDALSGQGMIAGIPVRCEAAAWAVRWHMGYPLRDIDYHDVLLLSERFGIELPKSFARVGRDDQD